jgi:hypothetical protein
MKKQTPVLAPFRWIGMAIIMSPILLVGIIAYGVMGLYCRVTRKDPFDYVNF